MPSDSALALSIAAICLAATFPVQATENPTWRASVTSERARIIAGDLFPDKCGSSGLACGITYDDRRKCPFEFVVVFPTREKGEAPIAIVTLDKHGGVLSVDSVKKGMCGSDKS
jgi:hypothetical protein